MKGLARMGKSIWPSELLKHAALICLFIFLPLLVAGGLGYHTLLLERNHHLEKVSEQLDTGLLQIGCETDSEVFIRKMARGAWHMVRNAGGDSQKLLGIYRSLQGFVPVDFDLYIFDEASRLVTPPQVQLKSRFLAGKLWEMIGCSPIEQNIRFQKLRRQLKAFLGNEFRMAHFLEGHDSVTQIITRQRHGMVYWVNDPVVAGRGILMIFWDIPDLNFRLRHVLKRMQKHFECIFAVSGDSCEALPGSSCPDTEATRAVFRKLTLLNQKNHFDDQGQVWAGRQIDGLWAIGALKTRVEGFDASQNAMLLALFLVAGVALAVYVRFAAGASMFFPIRMKLLGLFLVAVISPVMGFAYLGYRYLGDREATLIATVSNRGRHQLVSFDESFRSAGASFIEEFRELSRAATAIGDSEVRRSLESRLESNNLITFELRNASNAEVLFALQNEMVFEGMREVSDAFSRFCLDNTFGSNLTSSVDPLLDMAVRSPEAGLWFFFDRPDEVHHMAFGPVPMFIFWNTIRNVTDSTMLYVYILQSATRLTRQLMRHRLIANLAENSARPFTLAAMNNQNDTWLPARVHASHQLRDFAGRLLFSGKPDEIRLRLNGEEYLVSGQRGKYLGSYSLFAFYPYRLISDEIARLRSQILLAMLLFTILAMMAAWLLSDTFLLPVARLGNGVAAIKARNPDFRIEQDQQDEFGDLAASFNHMIADLKEMQLAQDVQESLLPAAPPRLAGYQVSFTNRMASAVGGDYFDVHVLDEDNICVIIGDVAGHGVGSALVMAMAKAIVYHGLNESRDLISLFSDLNRAVHTYFSRPPVRKMITLFAATINLSTGKGTFVNAGHNFPVRVSAAGKCEDLASVHLPLGSMASIRSLKSSALHIEPGDTLVFYTDGLVEVVNPAGEQFGYERLKALLAANVGVGPEDLSHLLMNAWQAWLAGGEPDDDVTLVILQRQNRV